MGGSASFIDAIDSVLQEQLKLWDATHDADAASVSLVHAATATVKLLAIIALQLTRIADHLDPAPKP